MGTDKIQKDQLAVVYAALVLNGDGENKVEITSDKLTAVLKAANLTVNPFFPSLYAKVLKEVDIKELVLSGTGGGAAAGPVSAGAQDKGGEKKEEEKPKEEEKKEEPEEESASIGGLFGSDDDDDF